MTKFSTHKVLDINSRHITKKDFRALEHLQELGYEGIHPTVDSFALMLVIIDPVFYAKLSSKVTDLSSGFIGLLHTIQNEIDVHAIWFNQEGEVYKDLKLFDWDTEEDGN